MSECQQVLDLQLRVRIFNGNDSSCYYRNKSGCYNNGRTDEILSEKYNLFLWKRELSYKK